MVGISDGYYRRYFLSTLLLVEEARRLTDDDRRLLAECKRPTSLAIILNLAVDGPLRHKDLEQRLGRTKGTISFHLARLVNLGLVRQASASSGAGYVVVNPSRIVPLLVTFPGSRRDHVDAFASLWIELGSKER